MSSAAPVSVAGWRLTAVFLATIAGETVGLAWWKFLGFW